LSRLLECCLLLNWYLNIIENLSVIFIIPRTRGKLCLTTIPYSAGKAAASSHHWKGTSIAPYWQSHITVFIMSSIEIKSASGHSLDELALIFNGAFAGYPGRIPQHTAESLQNRITTSFIDLHVSRIIYVGGTPCGLALIARRGFQARLVNMGIATEARGKGVATTALETIVEEARTRCDTSLELEVLEDNVAAAKLYRRVGFKTVRRLTGWECERPLPLSDVDEGHELDIIPVEEVVQLLSQHGATDLPWQIASFSLRELTEPAWIGVRLEAAYAIISNPDNDVVCHKSLFVLSEHRRKGQATGLLNALFKKYPGKTWAAPFAPADYGEGLARKFGFKERADSPGQFQMQLKF